MGAFAVTRAMSSLLFETSSFDPATLGAGSLALITIALLACHLPARRGVDSMFALRRG